MDPFPPTLQRDAGSELFCRGLGERIHAIREARGIPIPTIARELGVDAATVRQWEAGDATPSAFSLCQIARLLGATMDHLCGVSEPQSIVAGAGIIDTDAMVALRLAAGTRASLRQLQQWMCPPGIAVVREVPQRFQVVGPAFLADVRQEVAHYLRALKDR